MCRRSLDAITMVYTAFASFVVDIEVLEVIVEIDAACAEVATEEGGVCGEYGCYVDVAFSTEGDSEAGLPFVEMSNDRGGQLVSDELCMILMSK